MLQIQQTPTRHIFAPRGEWHDNSDRSYHREPFVQLEQRATQSMQGRGDGETHCRRCVEDIETSH